MAYVALYRKWRPIDFSDLVGQDHISHTLSQAIKSGKIGHAYLFSGPRGTGKTSTAKILAKALNCEKGPTAKPCNKCSNCQKINDNVFMDVYEIDAASNRGIDEIRDLRETVKFAPAEGKYKVYIIDEVHMLTSEAFNALLKTLEEPPSHVVFILATTEIHKVPATIQSRCQRYDFKRITAGDIRKQLQKVTETIGIDAEPQALEIIAIQADGGLRDALSLLDQCTALSDKNLTAESVRNILGIIGRETVFQITESIIKYNTQEILQIVDKILLSGKSISQLFTELALHWRSLMVYKAVKELPSDISNEEVESIDKQAQSFTHEHWAKLIETIYDAQNQLRWSPQPRVTAEIALMKLCYPSETVKKSDNVTAAIDDEQRISRLEEKITRLENLIHNMETASIRNLPQADFDIPAVEKASTAINQQAVVPAVSPSLKKATIVQTNAVKSEVNKSENMPQGEFSPQSAVDAAKIWQMVLVALKEQHKAPALACVEKATARSIQNGQLVLVFRTSFLKSRTERPDYKDLIESILLAKTGQNINIACVLEETVKGPPPEPKEVRKKTVERNTETVKTESVQNHDSLSSEEKERLQAAVDLFGGNIINGE